MAEAVVSFAVDRLGELLISEAKLLYGLSEQINEVQRELERMQCFLEEADRKQNSDKRIRKWVAEMRGLAFKTEDVIEYFALEVATKKQNFDFVQMLQRVACLLSEGISRHKIAKKIRIVKSDLIDLTSSLSTYGITKGLEGENSSSTLVDLKSRRTYSHDIEKDFVGMENEIEQLISHLKKEDIGCEVVSICGMGGQGKTSLAQKLYNHTQVKAHFKAFAWVCITHQFEREKVLKGILKQLFPTNREGEVSMMEDAELVEELYKFQQEKNCLIVVDDIWTIDSWRSLKPAFPVGETTSGTKILLTTRDVNVAAIGSIYKIEGLTEEQGWQLLSKKAGISDRTENMVAFEIERIGKNMVKRCKGLPLAISSLGGILKGKSFRDWEIINKDVSFYLSKVEGVANDDEYYTVRQVLGLSYDSLPPRLRHCFLCFANYEEDEKIKTEELYMFWIAEGLISVEDKAEGEMMLDVAERYLDELARRSLVQVETSEFEGVSPSKYLTCSVHDLIRDLCLYKVKEEKVIKVIHSQSKLDEVLKASIVRRLCIRSFYQGNGSEFMFKHYDRQLIQNIRCLSVWSNASYSSIHTTKVWPNEILSLKKFKLLRVLTASGYIFTKHDIRNISELVYLKYLCLRDCRLKELPSSIGNLRNLETLDLRVSNCIRIPNVLWKLKQMKHLFLPKYLIGGRLEKLRLEGLNELQLICNYDSVYCDTQGLIRLYKLKVFGGKIIVDLTENIIGFIKSRELRHSDLHIGGKGKELCLVLLLECGFIDVLRISSRVSVFRDHDHTRFSGRLTELYLFGCRMEQDPMILLEKLCNLRDLFMDDYAYVGEKMVCTAMGFPKLQYLFMRKLPSLRYWSVFQGAMPNLSNIEIYKCEALEMLPEGLRYLTVLEYLRVSYMPSTFTKRIEVIDGVEGEDLYKVRHIPDVIISRYL